MLICPSFLSAFSLLNSSYAVDGEASRHIVITGQWGGSPPPPPEFPYWEEFSDFEKKVREFVRALLERLGIKREGEE